MEAAQVQVMFHIKGVETAGAAAKLLDVWLQSAQDDDRLMAYWVAELEPPTIHSCRVL